MKLIVLRGPSGSGKSTTAQLIRPFIKGPTALIEQDYFRRTVLKEKDIPNGLNQGLIKQSVLFALSNGYNVVMEGIFDAERYNGMFEEILVKHPDNNHFFYFDVSLNETLRRHEHKPNKDDFGETEMGAWYKDRDLLRRIEEVMIPESSSLNETVDLIVELQHT